MLFSLVAGGGGMAQFSRSEFGGPGNGWPAGSIMISDMFNNALKARVDAFVQRIVSPNSERTRTSLLRNFSIAKPGRAQEFAT